MTEKVDGRVSQDDGEGIWDRTGRFAQVDGDSMDD